MGNVDKAQTKFLLLRTLFCIVFQLQTDLSKLDFSLCHLDLAPQLGITSFEFRRSWYQKTTSPLSCPSYGIVCVILSLAVLVEQTCDGRRDGRTDTTTANTALWRRAGKNVFLFTGWPKKNHIFAKY